jgi:endonuclease/exonuclease/phosphatase family metal-dependent hydrolase
LKIVQINAWLGRLNGPLVRFVAQQSPDILCLQEVLLPAAEDLPPFHDQYGFVEEIQNAANLDNLFFTPAWGFTMSSVKIDVGLAILARHPILNKEQLHISNQYYVTEKVGDYQRNTRAFQSASIELGNGKIISIANYQGYLAGAHASGDETSELLMKKVEESVSDLQPPLIFCGDFNVSPATPTMRVLDSLGLRNLVVENGVSTTLNQAHRAPKSDRNSVVCDYILTSPDIKIKEFTVSEEVVSDHKALILEFEI